MTNNNDKPQQTAKDNKTDNNDALPQAGGWVRRYGDGASDAERRLQLGEKPPKNQYGAIRRRPQSDRGEPKKQQATPIGTTQWGTIGGQWQFGDTAGSTPGIPYLQDAIAYKAKTLLDAAVSNGDFIALYYPRVFFAKLKEVILNDTAAHWPIATQLSAEYVAKYPRHKDGDGMPQVALAPNATEGGKDPLLTAIIDEKVHNQLCIAPAADYTPDQQAKLDELRNLLEHNVGGDIHTNFQNEASHRIVNYWRAWQLNQAITSKARQLLRIAQEKGDCIAVRYAGVFFTVLKEAIEKDVAGNPLLATRLMQTYSALPQDFKGTPVNKAESEIAFTETPYAAFNQLANPILRATIDAGVFMSIRKKPDATLTDQQITKLREQRNDAAQMQEIHDAMAEHTRAEIAAQWNSETYLAKTAPHQGNHR